MYIQSQLHNDVQSTTGSTDDGGPLDYNGAEKRLLLSAVIAVITWSRHNTPHSCGDAACRVQCSPYTYVQKVRLDDDDKQPCYRFMHSLHFPSLF